MKTMMLEGIARGTALVRETGIANAVTGLPEATRLPAGLLTVTGTNAATGTGIVTVTATVMTAGVVTAIAGLAEETVEMIAGALL